MHIDKSKVEVPGSQSGIRFDGSMDLEISLVIALFLVLIFALFYQYYKNKKQIF